MKHGLTTKMPFFARFAVILIASLALLVACSGGGAPADQSPGDSPAAGEQTGQGETGAIDEFVAVTPLAIKSMDPAFTTSRTEIAIARNIFSGLVKYKYNSSDFEGDLAEDWEVSEDGTVYTFKLRQGVQFHHGYGEVTAEDVVFTFERIRDPEVGSRWAADLAPIKSVEALDPYTVQITLHQPYPALLHLLVGVRQGAIVSKKAVEEMGDEQFNLRPVGSGPYALTEWVQGVRIVLEANEDFYFGAPRIKRAVFKFMPDEDTAILAYQNGEANLINLPLIESQIQQLADHPGSTLSSVNRTGWIFLMLNTEHPILSDIRVRQAIAHAIDKQAIVDFVYAGYGKVLDSFIPEGYYGYTDDVVKYEYDPEKAKQLLAEAGYPDGFTFTIDLHHNWSYQGPALAIRDQLSRVGITAELNITDEASWLTHVYSGASDASLYLPVRSPDPDIPLTQFIHSSSIGTPDRPGPNATKYKALDDLIEEARYETDDARRQELYAQIQRKISEDVPVIPLSMYPTLAAHTERLKGMPELDPIWDYYLFDYWFE